MDDKTIKKIAHEIATHLFTNGRGEKAMRLQLEMEKSLKMALFLTFG